MLKKPKIRKYKYTDTNDFDGLTNKLTLTETLALTGTSTAIKVASESFYRDTVEKVLKMFYLYLKIKLRNRLVEDQEEQFSIAMDFISNCIFSKRKSKNILEKYHTHKIKKMFEKEYQSFLDEIENDLTLASNLREVSKSGNIAFYSTSELKAKILTHVNDYLNFLEWNMMSKILFQDDLIEDKERSEQEEKTPLNLEKKTNIDILKEGIVTRSIEKKIHILNATLVIARGELELYLGREEYKSIKTEVLNDYNKYYREIVRKLHLKDNLSSKIRTHKKIFNQMKDLNINWVCNCADSGSTERDFYIFIYDVIMYKYKLLAYHFLNKDCKRTKQEIINLLKGDELNDHDEKICIFFNFNIRTVNDINAHIIKSFGLKNHKFIKEILAIKTRTKYTRKERLPTFSTIARRIVKYAPVDSRQFFSIKFTAMEHYRNNIFLNQ